MQVSRCFIVLLLLVVPYSPIARAQTPPWTLGDEDQMICYNLTDAVIATPLGLLLKWVERPVATLTANTQTAVSYNVSIAPEFWTQPSSVALLGTDWSKWYGLCTSPNPALCTLSNPQAGCCLWHINVHECRESTGNCEPYVKPSNGTDGTTLVTATASLVGPPGTYVSNVDLPSDYWTIVAHVKIMNFQCAIGAKRYVAPQSNSNVALIAGLTVGLGCFALILLVIAVVLRLRATGAVRDTAWAPKEAPLALLFTDIQSSTALWAEVTQSMGVAMDTHHDIIRSVIRKHKAYEVKTIGDSFMIACKAPLQAVQLAMDIQEELYKQTWPRAINDMYDNTGAAPIKDNPEDMVPCPSVSTTPYHGLRIRIGVHFGEPQVNFDPIAKGYDYYGPDVNLAARVESVAQGGQVLVSNRIHDAVDKLLGLNYTIFSAGEATLKGVKGNSRLFEVASTNLPGRHYQPLRAGNLEVDGDEEADPNDAAGIIAGDTLGNNPAASGGGGRGDDAASEIRSVLSMGGPGSYERLARRLFGPRHALVTSGLFTVEQLTALVLDHKQHYDSLLKPFSAKKKEALVKNICETWHVAYHPKSYDVNIISVIARVIQVEHGARAKAAAVADARGTAGTAEQFLSVRSPPAHNKSGGRLVSQSSNVSELVLVTSGGGRAGEAVVARALEGDPAEQSQSLKLEGTPCEEDPNRPNPR